MKNTYLICLVLLVLFVAVCGPKPKSQDQTKNEGVKKTEESLLTDQVKLYDLPKTRNQDDLYRTVSSHMGGIRYCYQKHLDMIGKGKGQVIIEFIIRTSGDVEGVEVIETFADVPEFLDCLKEAVARWRFDRIADDGDEPRIFYPFEFGF